MNWRNFHRSIFTVHWLCLALAMWGLTLGGCAGAKSSWAEAQAGTVSAGTLSAAADDWSLEGSRIISCCCGSPCPCRINKKPTHCHGCDNTTAVHIERGRLYGVDMAGVNFAWVACQFGEDASRNWGYTYVGDNATDEQYAALQRFLTESIEGIDPAKRPHLVGRELGIRRVPMTWRKSTDGREWSMIVPGILDLRTRAIILPGHDKPVTSSAIFDDYGDSFIHADIIAHTFNDPQIGKSWDLKGRQANHADFLLDSQRVARGGLGWGCWSAHNTFGDDQPYAEKLGAHP